MSALGVSSGVIRLLITTGDSLNIPQIAGLYAILRNEISAHCRSTNGTLNCHRLSLNIPHVCGVGTVIGKNHQGCCSNGLGISVRVGLSLKTNGPGVYEICKKLISAHGYSGGGFFSTTGLSLNW